jgi:hypothetical protein
MHPKSPKIQEDMAFPKWPSVKQKLQKSSVWKLCCIALFEPLKQMFPELNSFWEFTQLYNKLCGTISLLEVWSDSAPIIHQN